jgi:peptide/nickel transport system permease protein
VTAPRFGFGGAIRLKGKRLTRPDLKPGPFFAAVFLLLLILCALFPGLFARFDPLETDLASSMLAPSTEHWFGTDKLGRDIFTRVVHGARISLTLGVAVTCIAVASSTIIGVGSALAPKAVDSVIMRGLEIVLAFPELLIALVIVAFLGPGTNNVILAVTISSIPLYTRIVRITTIQVNKSAFVEASLALGQPRIKTIIRHIIPNSIGPMLVLATIGIGTAIMAGSALSFLGLGPAAPTPEWGLMLSEGRNSLGTAWWVAVFPGLAITATVISTTVLGHWVQAKFERVDT